MELTLCVLLTILVISGGSPNKPPSMSMMTRTLTFPENTIVDTKLFQCNATDPDNSSTANGTVSYNFFSGNQARKFSMSAADCQVYLTQSLDYETAQSYTLYVRATDGGGLHDEEIVTIIVTDVNDNAPSCTPSLIWGSLAEDEKPYKAFATLSCTDPDTGQGGNIEYNVLLGNSTFSRSDTIAVGRINGSAYILRSIDYDKEPDTFPALVQVIDQGSPKLTSTVTVILYVKDVDDNPPQFIFSTFQGDVNENVPLGFTILTANATDADAPNTPASLITYESTCTPDLLMIDRYSGDLVVKDDIDWEVQKVITCTVYAFSEAHVTSTATVSVTVHNINDGYPTFQKSFYSVSVDENANVGTTLTVVPATDPENDGVDYSTDSSVFHISANGAVTVAVSPDYEKDTSYLVTLTVTDKGTPPLSATALLQVSINPVNEFSPVFVGGCSGSVSEDAVAGTSILTVTTYDNDTGLDGAVSYTIQTQNMPFYLDKTSGFIGVATPLDYETTRAYTFVIVATDNSPISKRSTPQSCTITVIDVNDQAVECQPPNITVIQYPFPIGKKVAGVNCSVSNSKPPQLRYAITAGNDYANFQIDPSSGDVTLESIPLSQTFTLNITVTFGADTTNTTLIIFAEEELKMINLPATLDIIEEQLYGPIFSVNACCAFPKVEFTLVSGNSDKRITLTSSNGQIRFMVPFDREKYEKYPYIIQARSDSGQTVTGTLTVNVLDINDNSPEFSSGVYEISVDETWPPGNLIQTYTATDKDAGNNSALTYIINKGDIGKTFSIGATGQLVLMSSLDYDAVPRYELEIFAIDHGSPPLTGTTLVVVNVKDNNQHPPQLVPMGGPYSVSLSEDSDLGRSVFQLRASDNDNKSSFVYNILSGNTNNDFQIVPNNGTIIIAKLLDRERTPFYVMNLSATNQNGVSVSGTLNINITDVNDNSPVFSLGVYVFYLADQTNSGVTVGTLNVTDADLGPNATVRLGISSGNTGGAFGFSGMTLETKVQMNYPAVDIYQLTVESFDGGTPPRASTALVIVYVLNGNIPYFNTSSATVRVREDKYIATEVFDANATGKGAVENGSINYRIISGNTNNDFIIKPLSGKVQVANTLNYDKLPVYTLIITASNMASTSTSVTLSLTVSIDNVNLEDPYFSQHSFSFDVDETAKPNTPVETVLATDPDGVTETMSGPGGFSINLLTGQITVTEALDYLVKQYYNYIVIATDGGKPPRSTNASVVIRLRDVNNHAPVFISGSVAEVLDSAPIGSDIFQILATDQDTGDGGNVSYEIVNPVSQNTFTLNTYTGILQTAVLLDALITPSYTLTVRAYDAANPSLDNTTVLTINVISTNPNYYDPVFPGTCQTSVTIARNYPSGGNVLACQATDRDKGISGEIEYWIISGNDDGFFIIDHSLGSITAATNLLTAKNSYNMVVLAMDKGTPSRNASLSVTLDVTPAIMKDIKSNYTFTIQESAPVNTLTGVITVDNGITVSQYSITTGNYGNSFVVSLDGNNGKMVVKAALDRETYPLYSLIVQASTDVNDLTFIVEVVITDVNDNDPQFILSALNLAVPEYTPAGTTVYTVSYTDLDTDAVNRNNTLSVQGSTLLNIDQSGHLTLASVPDYLRDGPTVTFNIIVSDNQSPFHTSTLPVTISIIDVTEKENISTSAITDDALISLEVPYQAPEKHLVYTLTPGDFSVIPGLSAIIQFVAYETTSPFRIHPFTGDVTVSGSLADQTKYFIWAMMQVTEAGQTTSKISLIRIDTFDWSTQMAVIEFSASFSYVLDHLSQFRSRAQTFFIRTQRIGFCKLVDTTTGSRRRLLALQSAAYTYVVRNTSADDMGNINEPKYFLTEQQILDVLQKSPDGTPVTGLSDSSVVDVQTVEPYEESSGSDSDFDDFINSPAGIAVFCLLGLLILVLIILIITCVCYRKYSKNRRSKKDKNTETNNRQSFSTMTENPSYFSSNPQIIVSAPPPVTLHTPPIEKPSSPPSRPQNQNYDEPEQQNTSAFESDLQSQNESRDGDKNPPRNKNKSRFGKSKVTKIGKKTSKSNRKM